MPQSRFDAESFRGWIAPVALAAFALGALMPVAFAKEQWPVALAISVVCYAGGAAAAFFYARSHDETRSAIESDYLEAQQTNDLLKARAAEAQERYRRAEAQLLGHPEELLRMEKGHRDELARAGEKTAAALQQAAEANATLEELRAQRAAMEAELAESQQRRAALEMVHTDILSQLDSVTQERASVRARSKELEVDLHGKSQALAELQREVESARAEAGRLAREMHAAQLQRDTALTRTARSSSDLADARARAEDAETQARAWQDQVGANDEINARRREVGDLLEELRILRLEKTTEADMRAVTESELNVTRERLNMMEAKVHEGERLLEEWRSGVAASKKESLEARSAHFTFKLNHFDPRAVTLNFVNLGLPIEICAASCEGGIACEVPNQRRVVRGGASSLRLTASQLPKEFLLRIRYTCWPEEAIFRIRPFEAAKIEMIAS